MKGLLIAFQHAPDRPEPLFWKLFGAIRHDLDRLYWCFLNQPWFGTPLDFDESFYVDFPGVGNSSIMLWRPGGLSRYADRFSEEFITLFGIEPTRDDPVAVAEEYYRRFWREDQDEVIKDYARVLLQYRVNNYWECYCRKDSLVERLRDALLSNRMIGVYDLELERRDEGFRKALGWSPGEHGL